MRILKLEQRQTLVEHGDSHPTVLGGRFLASVQTDAKAAGRINLDKVQPKRTAAPGNAGLVPQTQGLRNNKKMKTLKTVTIEAMFPELLGTFSVPRGRGQASNVRAAGANAIRDLLNQVKGKKFKIATATIRFGTVQVE